MDALALVARILFVLIFLSSGLFGHLGPGRPMLTQFAAGRKIPSPGFLVPFSGCVDRGGKCGSTARDLR